MPNLAQPNLTLPKLTLPNLAQPNLALPNLSQPDLALPNLAQPNLALMNLALPNLALPNLAQPSLALPNLALQSLAQPCQSPGWGLPSSHVILCLFHRMLNYADFGNNRTRAKLAAEIRQGWKKISFDVYSHLGPML